MKNKKFGNRENPLILTETKENNVTTVCKKRRAVKMRLAAVCMLLVMSVFAAFFGFAGAFAPINTIDKNNDNTAYAAIADDWITVATNGGTFTLTENWTAASDSSVTRSFGSDTNAFYKGALLVKGKNVTIDLNGHYINRALTSARTYGAVIYVLGGGTLTIKDSSGTNSGAIKGGFSSTAGSGDYGGGGIGVSSGTLNIEGGTISGNGTSAASTGSAIHLKSSTLKMTGGVISSNTCSGNHSGAIFVGASSKVTLSDVQIKSNTASGTYSSSLRTESGYAVTMTDCTVSGNTASGNYSAGGVMAYGGSLTLNGGTISTNTASGTGTYTAGGIMAYNGSTVNINGTTISGNTAKGTNSGGGICIAYGSTTNKVYMTDGSITGNTATGTPSAGGVSIMTASHFFQMTGGTISGNKGISAGGVYVNTDGALRVGGAPKIENNTLSTNVKNNVTFKESAGFITLVKALETGANIGVTKLGNNYVFNSARLTSGYKSYNGTTDPASFFFADESTIYSIAIIPSSLSTSGEASLWSYSNAKNWEDACLASSATLTKTVTLTSDWTATTFGTTNPFSNGALYVRSTYNVVLDLNGYTLKRSLSGNTAYGYVITVSGGKLEITDSSAGKTGKITGGKNSTTGTNAGGGIYLAGGGIVNLREGTITGNTTTTQGGGVNINNGTFNMYGGTISGNTGTTQGGGVFINANGTFNMFGGTISGNTSKEGGGVYYSGTAFKMTGGAITGNSGSTSAGGVFVKDGKSFSMGGASYVASNKTGSANSNVYLEGDTQVITITSAITATTKTGITRGVIGDVTSGWTKYNSGIDPTTHFAADSNTMMLMASASGEAAFLSTNNVDNWTGAVKISVANNGKQQTVRLASTWNATSGSFGTDTDAFWNGGLYVPSGANIILDLAGFTIDRKLTSTAKNSPIIRVNGTLEIIDSSTAQTGTITGGYSNYASSGSNAYRAGGIAIEGGTVTMRGGTISNCKYTTSYGGGGVQINSSGSFKMYGGTIKGCQITDDVRGAGGVFVQSGTFYMYGGTITGNSMPYYATIAAAGVALNSSGSIYVSGDVKITGNNFTDGTGADVVFNAVDRYINIVGALSDEASIGIRREVNNVTYPNGNVFTYNYARYNPGVDPVKHFFASENLRHRVIEGKTEGTLICIDNETNWTNAYKNGGGTVKLYSDWKGDNTATKALGTGSGFSNGALYLNGNCSITLDLNGFTINRGLNTATAGGYVIYLYNSTSSLTIIDSSEAKTGKITGGYNKEEYGGGIYMKSGGTLTLLGGDITGNRSSVEGAGGVYVSKGGIFKIGGSAAVYGNTAASKASNIYCVDVNQMITVSQAMTSTNKSGITRNSNGEFTTGFAKYMAGKNAADYFSCDNSLFFVVTSVDNEASMLTTDNSANWEFAVLTSLGSSGKAQFVSLCNEWKPKSSYSFGSNEQAYYEGAMYVPKGASIILDLSGFTINRGLTSTRQYGFLFYVCGTLTIRDSSADQSGIIKGGYNTSATSISAFAAGAISIASGGTVTIEGGTITGNRASGNYGVGAICNYGSLYLYGGNITGNTGTYVGGVYSYTDTIYAKGSINLCNNVKNNNVESNLYFRTQTLTLGVTAAFTEGARIGITPTGNINNYTSSNLFTRNYKRYNPSATADTYFFSDSKNYEIRENSSEARIFCVNNAINWANALEYNNCTFTLYSDWNAVYDSSDGTTLYESVAPSSTYIRNGALYLSSNRNITIDLNGFTINRALKSSRSNGYVIYNNGGTLQIIDSSSAKTGKITGGYSNDGTGGIMVKGAGVLKISGGAVSGNFGTIGAGVYVDATASLYIGGEARIENNKNLSGIACNIYLTGSTQVVNVMSKIEPGRVFGITRAANGDVTSGWVKYNPNVSPEDYFVSEHNQYDATTGDSGELAFLSPYIDVNWQNAVQTSLNTKTTQTVKLTSNWIPDGGTFGTGTGYYDGMLWVPSGASIILDMNGFNIDRKITTARTNGGIFRVQGELSIVNRKGTGSIITGGNNTYNSNYSTRAGGITVQSGGQVSVSGTIIQDNKTNGNNCVGGVYIYSGAVFTMLDAEVKGNTGAAHGGVLIADGARFNVGGATVIEGNTMTDGAKRDVEFLGTTDKIYVTSALTSGAHIGVYKQINNFNNDGHNVITWNYGRYNKEDVDTYFFACDAPSHVLFLSSGSEVAFICHNNKSNWVNAINAASSRQVTFTLYSDWVATDGSFGSGTGFYGGAALSVPSSRNLIIDLNGYTINRNLKTATGNGFVLCTDGRVYIIDSSAEQTGTITGGYSSSNVKIGGIYVRSSTLTIKGGTITGNSGYGVYVHSSANLELGGNAKVVGNTIDSSRADIFLADKTATVNIVSTFYGGAEFGISKDSSGTFTTNYGRHNTESPDTYFTSQDKRFYVTDNELTGTAREGVFISTDPIYNWTYAVQTSIDNRGRTEKFKLLADWEADDEGVFGKGTGFRSGILYVPSNASVILDLNGFAINKRNISTYRSILFVDGTLEIIDSKGNDTGKITGGSTTGYYSGSYDHSSGITVRYGSVTMKGGSITGNTSKDSNGAAGVFIHSGATFTMLGGKITGNSGYVTGGVRVANGGTLNLGGSAKIYENVCLDSKGVVQEYYSDVYFYKTSGVANIVAKFNSDAKIGIKADIDKLMSSGNVITYGWDKYNKGIEPDTVFHSDQPDDYGILSEKFGNGTEAILFCFNNERNWTTAVKQSLSEKNTQTFRLFSNWKADTSGSRPSFGSGTGYTSGALRVPSGASIILDLHGFDIDRQMSSSYSYGYVIYVEGTLKIIDSTVPDRGPITQGKITGGYTSNGGGIYVYNRATLTITGGAITGNKATNKGGGIYVQSARATFNIGGTAQIYGNTDANGKTSNVYLYDKEQLINIVEPMRFDYDENGNIDATGKIGVMRGTLSGNKAVALGQLTSGWGAHNPDIDPIDCFTPDTEYITISSIGFDEECEALILSSDNHDNWVYAVTTSLEKNMTMRFTLTKNWVADEYRYYKYYGTSFGKVANCFQSGGLLVPAGASIVMDLNGFNINRNHDQWTYDYQYAAFNFVIYVEGSLQIVDSSTEKKGTITDGSYGVQIAEDGFVCVGALPNGLPYMNGNGSRYVIRDESRDGGTISGNSIYGVYSKGGTLVMTGGKITSNSSGGAYMGVAEAIDETSEDKESTVMLGGNAYIYNESKSRKDLILTQYAQIKIISRFTDEARVGFNRDTVGQLTSGWGAKNGNDRIPVDYFITKGSDKYTIEWKAGEDGNLEVFLTSYDNALNWQFAVTKSLETGEQQEFTMYGCWIATGSSRTYFGSTSAFKNGALYVPVGANVVLNLNGHKLDRNLTGRGASSGYVIIVDGTLEIIDKLKPKPDNVILPDCCDRPGGLITGGYNTSGSSAGAIHIGLGTVTLNDVTIKDNLASSKSASAGAIYVGGTFIFNSGTIINNEGATAGAIYVASTGNFAIPAGGKSALITQNHASGAGGGAVYASGVFDMYSGTISKNNGMIGGVYVANDGKFTLKNDAVITENEGNSAGGVFVYNSETTYFNMEGGSITKNEALSAGGIYAAGTVNMTGGLISENTASGSTIDDGGSGMYLAGSANVTITGGKITRNVGINGVRVYSSGTLNLGGSAYIAENISTDPDFIAAESKNGEEVYCDVFLTAETRRITIVSKFNSDARIGVNRIGAGVITKNFGKFNPDHPNKYFFSNKSIYSIAMTVPEEDTYTEASVGTPIDAPTAYLVDGNGPVYSGQWQTVIVGYNTDTMQVEALPEYIRGENRDANGNIIIEAVNAGMYIIAFTPAPSYCWQDGSTAPKQIHATIMPAKVNIIWQDETHTDDNGNTVNCKYDGVTVHVPKAMVDSASLFINVLSGEKDECTVDVDGATIFASGEDGHTAVAVMLSNSNYELAEDSATHKFYVDKTELPDFKITTEQVYFNTPCTILVGGNIENGKLHYSLPDNPANVTIDAETGELFTTEKDLTKRIKVKVTVDATANYNGAEAVGEVEVLPGKVFTEFEQTEVTYGDTVQLSLKGYNAAEMGAVTYTFNNVTGIGIVTSDGLFSTKRVGTVEVTATIAARGSYVETVIEGTITIVPRTITVDWGELSVTYDGNEHSPVVGIASGVLDADKGIVALTVSRKGTEQAAVFTDAGSYDISVKISSSNYKLAAEEDYNNVYEIRKADISPTFKDTTAYYEIAFTPEIEGNPGNGKVSFSVAESDAEKVKVEGNSFTPLNVGTFELTATVEETDNYNSGTVTATINVLPSPMPLKLTTVTTVYGDDLTLEAEGNDGSPVTFTLADESKEFAEIVGGVLKPKKVGTVTVKMSAPATSRYQAAVDVEGTVEITQREVEIIWDNLQFTYSKSSWLPTAEVKADDLVNGDSCTVVTITVKDFAAAINAGNYIAVASGLSNENYKPNEASLEKGFVIKPKLAQIAWEEGVTYTYKGVAQAPNAEVTNLEDGDSCKVSVLGTKDAAVGITAMALSLDNANYTLDGAENLTTTYDILPFQITVSWTDTTLTYNGKEQAPTATAVGLFHGDSCEIIVTGGQTNVGVYTATAISVENGNYKLKDDVEHTTQFTITKGTIVVTLSNENAIYGTPYQLEVQGAPDYSTITYTLGEGAENVILSGDRLIPMNVGTVTVTVTVAETDNFEETSDTKVITILPRPVEVSWDNLTFEYDKNSHIPTATISNLVNSDSCLVTVEGAQTDVGEHTASVVAITNNKYTLTGGGINLTHTFEITPVAITIEWGDTEFTYNGLEQHPSVTIGNLLEGDVCYAIIEGATDAAVNHIATLVGLTNNNYTIEHVENKTIKFNIYQKVVELEWSNLSFIYNGEEQGPSAIVTNLCAGDECTVTVAGKEVDVGTYAASAVALSNLNYVLPEEVSVTFTIDKAERSLELVETTTVYGTDLFLSVVGVEEEAVVTYSVSAGTGNATLEEDMLKPTAAGLVYVTVTIPATDNYKASNQTFEITIDKYAVDIQWEYDEFMYDGTEHKPVASVANVLEGETCEVLSVTGAIHAGKAQIAQVTAISNPNYTLEGGNNVTTTFTIRPQPVTIEWDIGTYVYNGNPQGPEAHVTDLVAGDSCGITVSGKNVNAGTYTARIVSLNNPDYTLDGAINLTTEYTIDRMQPVITIKTTSATLGINQRIEIEGNLGGGDVTFMIAYLGADGNEVISDGNELAYISGNMLVSQKVGTVTVVVYVGETINTLSAEARGEIEISKGKAPLAMDRTNVTYGNTLPLIVDDNDGFLRDENGKLIFGDVTFTVAPGEEDRAVIEGNVLRPLKAGTVHVIMSTGESDNFYATSVTVEITVAKRAVILEWSTESFTYNKTEQKPTATVTNLVGDDKVTVNVKGAVNAGENIKATAVSLSDEENYTLVNAQNVTTTFDINPLPVDIIWGELTLEFNGKHQYPEASVITIDNESCSVDFEGGGVNAGKYNAIAVGLSNSNYVLTENNRTVEFEITRAHITPVLSPTTAVYLQEVTLSISGNLEDGKVTYTVLADESEGNAKIDGDRFLPTKAGNVVIKINVEETVNCYAYEGTATIFVDKALRSGIDLVEKKTVYGTNLALAIIGNEEEPGTVTYTVANASAGAEPCAEISDGNMLITKHAGYVNVTVTIGETENYKQTVAVVRVEIERRVAEFEWINTEFDYNGQVQTPKAIVSNLVGDDKCEVTVTGGMKNAGTYPAEVSALSNPDYSFVSSKNKNTMYTIGKVEIFIELVNTHITVKRIEELSITGNLGEAPVTYTVANGTGTAVITDQGGEVSAEGQFIKGTRLGTVIVTAYVPTTTNYLAAEVKGLVIIEKDRPTITLKTDTVMYGETLKLEIDGNIENGFVTYSVSNATGSASYSNGILTPIKVGTVNVTVTVGATENYSMSSTTHEVTITPRPITGFEWSNFEFTYDGITIWAPTATVIGTLNNEPCDVVVGGGQIKAGRYTTAYAQSLTNPNYTLAGAENIHAPEFVINKVKPNIKILTTSITIGVPTIIEISGNNDNATVRYVLENGSGSATIDGGVITGTKLGEVYLTVSVPETANYLFGSASGVILVEKPETPVELENTQTVYGTDLTLSVLGNLENGDYSISLKDTELAELNGNVLTPKGVGEVTVVITVAETDTYKETVKEITVSILPRPIEVSWEYPEFTYDQTEHKPIATITNLVGDDECGFSVKGAVNAGTACEAYVYDLLNENYTVDNGVNVTTTFVIKPRPVTLSWEENCVFIYNGEVQTPKATVTDALEGDTVNISKIDGSKDVGENLIATALETDNPNYTIEGGTNLTTTYTIKPYEIDDPAAVVWGELTVVYNGKLNAPEAYAIIADTGEEVLLDVRGDGIHVRQDPYTANIVGSLNPNYTLSDAVINDLSVSQREYYIIPATVTFDEAELVKEYSGEFQQPEFKIHLFAEDDDLYIEVTGGGIAVGKYTVELELFGASTNDYVLSEEDKSKLFEIVKKSLTLKVTASNRNEKYTGEAVDISGWADWYTLALEGLLDADADKSIADLFTGNTLKFVPEIYAELDGEALAEVIEKGSYYILPVLQSGELSGAENYAISDIVYESGALTVGGKIYLELTEESKYQFVFEEAGEYNFKYLRAYAEKGMVHGVDDVNFETYVMGQIPLETTLTEFLANFADTTALKIYTNKDKLMYANGQLTEEYESIMADGTIFVGTGWRVEYGDGDERDIVYLSVLGDLDGNGLLNVLDTSIVGSYIQGSMTLDLIGRLSAELTNKGAISTSDLSAMSVVLTNGISTIEHYFTYQG